MSELINTHDNRATIRWKLLTGASALALAAYVSSAGIANAEDSSHPLIWLELDGQFAMQKTDLDVYGPDFLSASPFDAGSHLDLEKTRPNIWNKGASLSFRPEGSDWILSASIRFGKTGRSKALDRQTTEPRQVFCNPYIQFLDPDALGSCESIYRAYQDFGTRSSEGHTIIDFQAGKDVGLGKFGSDANSVISLGVRFAQFKSRSHVAIASQPKNYGTSHPYNRFYASFDALRKFEGLGPALSWNASAMIAGNRSDGGISLDWGVNGALLFGRQKTSEHHQSTRHRFAYHFASYPPATFYTPVSHARSKRVTVTNLGAFAGVSWRYAAAKVSMGYRADYFFNVLDGGIDSAKKEDRAFYGPFVSIAVGIGD